MSREVPFGALTMEREYPANQSPTVPTAKVKYGRHLGIININTIHQFHSAVHDVPELFIRKAVDDVIQALPVQNIDDPDSEAEKPNKNNCGEIPNLTFDKQLTLTH